LKSADEVYEVDEVDDVDEVYEVDEKRRGESENRRNGGFFLL